MYLMVMEMTIDIFSPVLAFVMAMNNGMMSKPLSLLLLLFLFAFCFVFKMLDKHIYFGYTLCILGQ